MSQNKDGQCGHVDNEPWLRRSGLWPMVCQFVELSKSYGLPWCESWDDHLENMDWIRRAMWNTFLRLGCNDKGSIRYEYELFLDHDTFCDWRAMAFPSFDALCFILDRRGRRVESEGVYQTVVRELEGATKQVAIGKLDTRFYEFIEWM
jgi:hypothetical protein